MNTHTPRFIDQGSFRAIREDYDNGNTLRFQILKNESTLSYGQIIDCWINLRSIPLQTEMNSQEKGNEHEGNT